MVDTVNNVKVRVSAENVSGASRDMARWKSNFEKATGGAAASMQRAERQIVASQDRIANALRNTAAVFGVGIGANEIVKAADSYTKLTNGLIAAGASAEDFANVQDRLYSAAQKNGTQAEALAQLYRRAALAGDALGVSQESLLNLTDGVAAALRVEGISAQEARGPLLQLGQALASPIVRAEELNSLMEGVPEIARAAARGFGVSVAEMRTAILDGEVTNKAFFQALQIGLVETEKLAEKIPLTIGNSFTVLGDALARYIGQTDDSLSATERISAAIQALANNLDKIVPVLATLSALIGVKMVSSLGVAAWATIQSSLAVASGTIAQKAYSSSIAESAKSLEAQRLSAQRSSAAVVGLLNAQAVASANTAALTRASADAQNRAIGAAVSSTTGLASSARTAGAALLGAFGGPVGLAITAVAGGLAYMAASSAAASAAAAETERKHQDLTRELNRNEAAVKGLRDESGKLIVGLKQWEVDTAAMTGEQKLLGDATYRAAAAVKAQRLEEANLRRDRARDIFEAKKAERDSARLAAKGASARGIVPLDPNYTPIMTANDLARIESEAAKAIEKQERSLKQAGDNYIRTAQEVADIVNSPLETFVTPTPSLGGGGGSGTSSKVSKDRQAEMRQRLDDERRLAEVRATGNAKAIQDEEDRQRLAELTASYTEAGYENAATLAAEVFGYEVRIRDLAKEREEIEKRREAYIDRTGKLLDRFEDRQNAIADFAREELQHRQEIARLTGDKAGEESARRELMLVEQIARYRSIGMNTADATAAANRRVDEIISAEKRGELRDTFAKSFSEGIRAIAAGDIQSFAANMAGSFAEQALQNLGEKFFDAIFGTSENIQTGTEIGLAQNSVLTPALVAASATMAATLSAAITTAGSAAAAAIGAAMGSAGAVSAFSSLPSFAGGGYTGNAPRSGGLDGKGGFLAMMHPRETVNDLTRGMPSPSSLTGSRGAMEVKQSFTINAQGSILASDIVKEIHRVGAQAISVAVDRSGRNMRKSLPSAMSKLDRYGTP